jgi:hypothetical protein
MWYIYFGDMKTKSLIKRSVLFLLFFCLTGFLLSDAESRPDDYYTDILVAHYKFENDFKDSVDSRDGVALATADNDYTGGGWIMVKAAALNRNNIVNAIKKGAFYASRGPIFDEIKYAKGVFRVCCPTAKLIQFIGTNSVVLKTVRNSSCADYSFQSGAEGDFVVARCSDQYGNWAWTNPIMVINGTVNNPYPDSGNWYRGNTHTHTTASDGELNISKVIDHYKNGRGYDFVIITDHGKFTPIPAGDSRDDRFIAISGAEYAYRDSVIHLVIIPATQPVGFPSPQPGSLQAAVDYFVKKGAAVILAHPHYKNSSADVRHRDIQYFGK